MMDASAHALCARLEAENARLAAIVAQLRKALYLLWNNVGVQQHADPRARNEVERVLATTAPKAEP